MKYTLLSALFCAACTGKTPGTPADTAEDPDTTVVQDVESWARGCYAIQSGERYLAAEGEAYAFTAATPAEAARFFLQPSDLGTYLFYDQDAGYLAADNGLLVRVTTLESDVTRIEDGYISGAEWILETGEAVPSRYQLRSRRSDRLMSETGLSAEAAEAAPVMFAAAEDCLEHPELSLDASGTITKTTFEDGDLYGIVDAHSHIMSNFGFGGGIFHGGAYHRLGVEHALPDCALYHGTNGRQDFFGYAYDTAGNNTTSMETLLLGLLAGELSEDNHVTAGYPAFTDWPDARSRATHQTQYYRWLERAHLAGLRFVVQHATTNSVICNLTVGEGLQPSWYDCEDMTAVDRIIDETWQMERYIDAQHGGSGEGWFRVVQTPAEAREVIAAGKMAIILGIETSDLFRCNLTPRPDGPVCDEAYVSEQLDAYYARGVRALFPVHKYDNQFTPGDGSGDFIELGNFLNSGHWTNKTQECPTEGMPAGFDHGGVTFSGLHSPRDEFLSPAPNDLSAFPESPLSTAMAFAPEVLTDPLSGEWCQNATITPLGESLIAGMMERGMIIEVDHFPQWSYQRVYEILEANDYPAAGTHGRDGNGRIYALGGISSIGFGRCQDPDTPATTLQGFFNEIALIEENGGYPAPGFAFDLNGFAGAPGPRFGEGACSEPQDNPTTYPFTSFAGDVEFTEPYVGDRAIDFDTEGMVHIGLLPEYLETVRSDAESDEDLEPLFRSAEGYIRMWERAEERAAVIRKTKAN